MRQRAVRWLRSRGHERCASPPRADPPFHRRDRAAATRLAHHVPATAGSSAVIFTGARAALARSSIAATAHRRSAPVACTLRRAAAARCHRSRDVSGARVCRVGLAALARPARWPVPRRRTHPLDVRPGVGRARGDARTLPRARWLAQPGHQARPAAADGTGAGVAATGPAGGADRRRARRRDHGAAHVAGAPADRVVAVRGPRPGPRTAVDDLPTSPSAPAQPAGSGPLCQTVRNWSLPCS